MHDPMYMLVNLAVGGIAGTPPDGLATPAEMQIDYIRAYSGCDDINGVTLEMVFNAGPVASRLLAKRLGLHRCRHRHAEAGEDRRRQLQLVEQRVASGPLPLPK